MADIHNDTIYTVVHGDYTVYYSLSIEKCREYAQSSEASSDLLIYEHHLDCDYSDRHLTCISVVEKNERLTLYPPNTHHI